MQDSTVSFHVHRERSPCSRCTIAMAAKLPALSVHEGLLQECSSRGERGSINDFARRPSLGELRPRKDSHVASASSSALSSVSSSASSLEISGYCVPSSVGIKGSRLLLNYAQLFDWRQRTGRSFKSLLCTTLLYQSSEAELTFIKLARWW